MKHDFSILMNVVSPHMLPLGEAIAKRVCGHFSYLAIDRITDLRRSIGWSDDKFPGDVILRDENERYEDFIARTELLHKDVVLMSIRDWRLVRARHKLGLKTYFQFERWFRPPYGMWRLLYPPFLRMAYHFAKALISGHYVALPIGVHAASDMARLCGLMSGDIRCFFRAPRIRFERKTGGAVCMADGSAGRRYGLNNMRMWSYYVGCGDHKNSERRHRAMWVGRYLQCKRVEDIIRASIGADMPIDLYGAGPEESRLRREYCGREGVIFHGPLSSDEVREQMRRHSVYIFASDASDGWGVVVNEAMIEGMVVVGSVQPGASATLIEDGFNGLLFNAGDVKALQHCLQKLHSEELRINLANNAKKQIFEKWMPSVAAKYLVEES